MVSKLSIILALISIGTILGPIGAVAIIYSDDLTQLVITPQIKGIMNGDSAILPDVGSFDNGDSNDNGSSDLGGLMNPVLVSAQVDEATNEFTGNFDITNPVDYDLKLNDFGADVQIAQGNIPAGRISLSNPVTVLAGETSQLTISGNWTQEAQNYLIKNYPDAASIDIILTNISIDVNGIIIHSSEPIHLSNIPVNVVS